MSIQRPAKGARRFSRASSDRATRLLGQEIGVSSWITIDQQRIAEFAHCTEDHQWIHVDVERAKKESPFKGTIAHGFLTLSLLPTLRAASDHKVVGYGNATNYGSDKLRFVSPVPAGSKVHARARLVAVEPKPKGTQVTQEIAVHVVGSDDRPALTYTMLVLYHPPVKK